MKLVIIIILIIYILSKIRCEVDFSGLTTTYARGEFETTGEVVITNVNCNLQYTYLYQLSATNSPINKYTINEHGTCLNNNIIITFIPAQLKSNNGLFLFILIKGSDNSQQTLNTRIGCQPIVENGSTWTYTAVSSNPAQGYCNDILAGVSERMCTEKGWAEITLPCLCKTSSGTVKYPKTTRVGDSSSGQCENGKIVEGLCTDQGWKVLSGSCEDCPAGPFFYDGKEFDIPNEGLPNQKIVLQCPVGSFGGSMVVDCVAGKGWSVMSTCIEKGCNSTVLKVGDATMTSRVMALNEQYEQKCPLGNDGKISFKCTLNGVEYEGKCVKSVSSGNNNDTTPVIDSTCRSSKQIVKGIEIETPELQDGGYQSLPCPGELVGNIGYTCEQGILKITNGCTAINDLGCSNTNVQYDDRYIAVPKGEIGENITVSCPDGYTGSVAFSCVYNGVSIGWRSEGECQHTDNINYYYITFITLLISIVFI